LQVAVLVVLGTMAVEVVQVDFVQLLPQQVVVDHSKLQ
jgi:hypothetical protein